MRDIDESIADWEDGYRIVVRCKKCKQLVHSKFEGQFTSCKCQSTFVDQTPYYCRVGGNADIVGATLFPKYAEWSKKGSKK